MRSAEWICTNCGTTNRVFLDPGSTATTDRCVTCHRKHDVTVGERPVRWEATASK